MYRHDFTDLRDVTAFQSAPKVNTGLRPGDHANGQLQKPTLSSNIAVVDDAAASDGKAMAVYTRHGTYRTTAGERPAGPTVGWRSRLSTRACRSGSPPG